MRDAAQLGEMATGLEKQLGRVHEQSAFLDALEKRLDQLLEIASEVDDRLSSQLTRRAEVDALGLRYDEIAAQAADTERKIEALTGARDQIEQLDTQVKDLEGRLAESTARIEALHRNEDALGLRFDEIAAQAVDTERKIEALTGTRDQIEQLDTQVKGLEGRLAESTARIQALQRDEAALEQHQSRLVDAADASRTLAEEAGERMKAMYTLVDQLTRTSVVSDQVVEALARVQALQREAVARAESLEKNMAEFARRSDEIDQVLRVIAERNESEATTVEIAARGGVDGVQATDVEAGGQQQTEMAALQQDVQELMAAATATEQKMAADVLQSESTITDLVEGARMNLRTASEQKEMVDQLNGRLANVQSVIREAHTTLRALNQERELLERIDQSIRQLRAPAGEPSPGEREAV